MSTTPMTKIREWEKTYNITSQEYYAIHYWLKHHFGSADKCENYDCPGKSKVFEWAKKRDKRYTRDRDSFMKLCSSCHRKYDTTEETRNKMRKISTGKKISEETKKRMSDAMKGITISPKNKAIVSERQRKPVAQLDDQGNTIKEWYSLRDASRYFKCDINTIKYAIKRGIKSRGFYWKLVPKSIRQHKEG